MFDERESGIIVLLRQLVYLAQEANASLRIIGIQQSAQTKQLEKIQALLNELVEAEQVSDFTLSQIQGDLAMAIEGTVLGATSSFTIGNVPATNFVPLTSGPTVTVDDTSVVLTPVDATNSFTAMVPSTDTGASYNLTITGVNGAGTTITHTFNVPILPLPPPPPVQVTDFSLNQNS